MPRLTPQSFETGMLAGEVRSRAITVENIGYSTWTGITAGAPSLSWVRLHNRQHRVRHNCRIKLSGFQADF